MIDSKTQTKAFTKLRSFLRSDPTPAGHTEAPLEQCELCSVPLPPQHRHLLEMADRKVVCACDACALRFQSVVEGRFKLIPRDARLLEDFEMSAAQWSAFAVPIDLAFIYFDSSASKRTALYPSPAGVTESLLQLHAWDELAEANPVLRTIEDDVEALLVNHLRDEPLYFAAPIDKCYELAGLIRLHWRGLSGGEEVWTHVREFFDRLAKFSRRA